MKSILQLAHLNARVAGLGLLGRWLGTKEVAAGYDCVAATYEKVWQCHLRRTTDEFLQRLPSGLTGTILDLGSGTGYTARYLASINPKATLMAIDVSQGMLNHARQQAPANMHCVVSDMLKFLQAQSNESVSMIVSTWAMGYSHSTRVLENCGRVLSRGGTLAFIVNYSDTLSAVFHVFQRCMLRFPNHVRLAAFPRFPKNWGFLQQALVQNRFELEWHQDGLQKITPPKGELLPWLRQTGVMAGFDAMLDLSGAAGDFFETELARDRNNLFHHFAAAIARKR